MESPRLNTRPAVLCIGVLFTLLSCLNACGNQPPLAWVQRFSEDGKGQDSAEKVYADSQGNVYVLGFSDNHRDGFLRTAVKYSANGTLVWSYSDNIRVIAVEENGNCILVGSAPGGSNVLTMKFSSSGNPVWTNRFLGLDDLSGVGQAVCVDDSGKIYVGARVENNAHNFDLVVLALTGDGSPLWTNRYSATGKDHGYVVSMLADGSGPIFLATAEAPPMILGVDGVSKTDGELMTLCYGTDGATQWTNFTPGWQSTMSPINLCLATGKVIVTSTSSNRCQTLAYSKLGVPLWTNFFATWNSKALDSAVGEDGTIYVLSRSGSSPPLAAIAYSSSGAALWTNQNNGYGAGIGVGTNGNVYVAGEYNMRLCAWAYTASGTPIWTNIYPLFLYSGESSSGLAMDASNRLYLAGTSEMVDRDFVTLACSSEGVPLWTNRFSSWGLANSEVSAVAVGRDGTIYVTGGVGEIGGPYDALTVAFSSDGTVLWKNRHEGPTYWYQSPGQYPSDVPQDITVGQNGNVYVAVNSRDFAATLAYSSNGVALWTNIHYDAVSQAMAVDSDDNLVVTGFLKHFGYLTYALSPDGIPLWTNRYWTSRDAKARDVALQSNGNVIITGYISRPMATEAIATIVYSKTGVPLLTNVYAPAEGGLAWDVAVAKSDKYFVAGVSGGNTLILAYSSTGNPLWTNRFGAVTIGSWTYFPYLGSPRVVVDDNATVYVADTIIDPIPGTDVCVRSLSVEGVPLWTNYFGLPDVNAVVTGIVCDKRGHIVVNGHLEGTCTGFDLFTVAYSTNGLAMWTNQYDGTGNGRDLNEFPHSIASGPDGEIVVACSSDAKTYNLYSDDEIFSFAILKFGNLSTPILRPPERLAGNQWFVGFEGSPGREYTIERSLNVTGPWLPLGTTNTGSNGFGALNDSNPFLDRGFYRGRFQ